MKKKLVVGSLVIGLLMTGCNSQSNNQEEEPVEVTQDQEQEVQDTQETEEQEVEMSVEISEWNGEWNSVDEFMNAPEVEALLNEVAEEEGMDIEEVRAEKLAGIDFPYGSMVVEGDKVIFNDAIVGEGEAVAEAEYIHDQSIGMEHAGRTYYWHVFETDAEGVDKYLVLMDVHGEETLAHFHGRIGNDVDELIAMEDWYPTFVRTDAPIELIAEEIAE